MPVRGRVIGEEGAQAFVDPPVGERLVALSLDDDAAEAHAGKLRVGWTVPRSARARDDDEPGARVRVAPEERLEPPRHPAAVPPQRGVEEDVRLKDARARHERVDGEEAAERMPDEDAVRLDGVPTLDERHDLVGEVCEERVGAARARHAGHGSGDGRSGCELVPAVDVPHGDDDRIRHREVRREEARRRGRRLEALSAVENVDDGETGGPAGAGRRHADDDLPRPPHRGGREANGLARDERARSREGAARGPPTRGRGRPRRTSWAAFSATGAWTGKSGPAPGRPRGSGGRGPVQNESRAPTRTTVGDCQLMSFP